MRLIRFRLHASRLFFAFKNTPHHHHHHHRVFTPTPTQQSRAMVASTKTTLPRRRRRQPPRRAALTSSSDERRPKRKRVTTFKSSSSAADCIDGELPDETRKKRRGPRKVLREDQNDEEKVVQRARTQICSQLTAMRRLQAYLDTYKLDGWRSSNQEKLKPTAELAKKRADIFHRKLKVRRLFETLNYDQRKLEKYKCREDSDGEIECDDVVCCECGSGDCEEDPYENDVVFCDGYCDLAYHMKCVKPPLKPEDVPKGDEGWLCPTCDCRVDVIYYLNLDHEQKLEIETCTHLDVFKEEQELFDKGIIPGTARFHLHGENEEDVWPSDESEDEDFKQKNEKDDGKDDSDESLSGSAIPEASNDSETSSSSESSSSSSSSDSAVIIEGPRRRTKVDYVKLNGDLFGDAVLDGDEEEKKDIKQPIDRRAQIAALVALKKKNDDDDNNNNNNKKKIRNKKWNKNGVTTTSPPARSGTTRKRPLTTSRGNNGRRTKDKASMSTPTKKRRGKSSSHSSPFTLPKPKAHETKKSRTLSPARRGGRKRSF